MLGQLEVVEGPDRGRVFPLNEGETLQIGRGPTTQTRLCDPFVSRVHCQVSVENGTLALSDLGGAGGTFVNGAKVNSRHLLHPGDVIALGDTRLSVEMPAMHEQGTIIKARKTDPDVCLFPQDLSQLAGQNLDHFHVDRLIARGQCGWVFAARDTIANQTIALKVLLPEFSDNPEDWQRITRGVATALPLRHRHLVSVLGVGRSGPFGWIAMEFVDGEGLTQIIQRIGIANILDWRYALRVAIQVGRALDFLHSQGIVHRNITPANILVETKDNIAKFSDVMLAKALEGNKGQQQLTRPGQMLGDLAYLAPERTVDSRRADARADIYGLGATVYALLTGHPPCLGKTPAETVDRIRTVTPASPRTTQLSIPAHFERIVQLMLAKSPDDRYQSAKQFLPELELIAHDERVSV